MKDGKEINFKGKPKDEGKKNRKRRREVNGRRRKKRKVKTENGLKKGDIRGKGGRKSKGERGKEKNGEGPKSDPTGEYDVLFVCFVCLF